MLLLSEWISLLLSTELGNAEVFDPKVTPSSVTGSLFNTGRKKHGGWVGWDTLCQTLLWGEAVWFKKGPHFGGSVAKL